MFDVTFTRGRQQQGRSGWRRILITLLMVLASALAWGASTFAAPAEPPVTAVAAQLDAPHVPGRILVKFKPGVDDHAQVHAQIESQRAAAPVAAIPQLAIDVVDVDPADMADVIAAYQANPAVAYAEPDYLAEAAFDPNDPYYTTEQYSPKRIEADLAWNTTTGDANIVVAVLDSGANFDHPDLHNKLVAGWDYVNSDADPSDDQGHGTFVTGIIAADTNNGEGIAGIGYNTRVLVMKVLNQNNSGSHSNIAQAIIDSTDLGARIINLSLGGTTYSSTMRDAVDYAWNHGALVVAAAGNGASSTLFYPAAYDNAMAVVATGPNDEWWTANNYGNYIDVSAPGDDIYSTYWATTGGDYFVGSGTSAAAPHVSGLAALLLARNGGLSNTELRSIIESTADDLWNAGWDPYFGYGRINAYAAVDAVAAGSPPPAATATSEPTATAIPPTATSVPPTATPIPPTATPMPPTATPTSEPISEPTSTPTNEPISTPTNEPTSTPTNEPTSTPTNEPTSTPTNEPTSTPTNEPTSTPTNEPTATPPPPTATPEPAGGRVTVAGPTFNNNKVRWTLYNSGGQSTTLTSLSLTWPAVNRKLRKVKLNGDTIFDQKRDPTSTTIDGNWSGDANRRTLAAGQAKVLELEFEDKHSSSNPYDYNLQLGFDDADSGSIASDPAPMSGTNGVTLTGPTFDGNKAHWAVYNGGSQSATVSAIALTWPAANGKLKKIKADRDVIFDAERDPTSTAVSGDWEGDDGRRSVGPGATKVFEFEFESEGSQAPVEYSLELQFQ